MRLRLTKIGEVDDRIGVILGFGIIAIVWLGIKFVTFVSPIIWIIAGALVFSGFIFMNYRITV